MKKPGKKQKTRVKARPHHRTASGRVQRERTRARIIAVAIRIFSEHGPYRPLIGDFVAAAGVSRGTFYNYFDTVHELLEECARLVANSCILEIEDAVKDIPSPIDRFACALRLYLRRAYSDAVFSAFVVAVSSVADRLAEKLARDIDQAMRQKLMRVHSRQAAFVVASGTGGSAIRYALQFPKSAPLPEEEAARLVLRAWRVRESLIENALARPLPSLNFPSLW